MSRPAGLYIHVPFCKTKCPYCDFYSVTDLSSVEPWLSALNREILFYKGRLDPFDSLYIGGGTPSVLDVSHTERLFNTLFDNFRFSADTEITVEVNPDDVTEEKLTLLRSLGVNRLSIGVQSFNNKELSFLNRRNTVEDNERAITLVKTCGFTNFGIDLMYGLPGQTQTDWRRTLKRTISFDPPHLSCYQFTLEEGTPLGKLKSDGKLTCHDEKEESRFFLNTSHFLKKHTFIHYEISNFAKARRYSSRHNLKYWHHVPYLGLGPAAHSFQNNKRWWNFRSLEKYIEAADSGKLPIEGSEMLSPEQLRLERLYLGFRTEDGVLLSDLTGGTASKETLDRLMESGLVRRCEDRVAPTLKGFLIVDKLPLMFGE